MVLFVFGRPFLRLFSLLVVTVKDYASPRLCILFFSFLVLPYAENPADFSSPFVAKSF